MTGQMALCADWMNERKKKSGDIQVPPHILWKYVVQVGRNEIQRRIFKGPR